jgi:hypothetical protein
MRIVWGWGLALLALAGAAQAQQKVYKRGDFEFSVAPVPAFVVERPLPVRWPANAPGGDGKVPWRTWRTDEQSDWRGGKQIAYVDYAFEVRSPSLIGDAGKYSITFNPEYQQLAIHRIELRRDGQWQSRLDPERISLARRESGFEEDSANGQVTALIVLDDVRVDDVVRITYTTTGGNPILAGQALESSYFGWRHPLLDARLRVIADPGTHFNVHREHGAPDPKLVDSADGAEVLLAAEAQAPVVDEQNYPVWYQPFPRAQVSVRRSWADVVAWALPLYPDVDGPLPEGLEQQLGIWSKLPGDEAKLQAALRAVQDEVRYFGVEMGENTHRPAAPADTWTRRRGDCKDKAYLLVTLLRRMGIRAEPALTSIDDGRAVQDQVPSAYDFDHVIVRAQIDGKPVWADATMTQQGGEPSATDLSPYGVALPIARGSDALQTIAPPAKPDAGIAAVERYLPSEDGRDVRLEVSTTYQGVYADMRRRSLAGERVEDRARRYADYYRKRFGDLRVISDPVAADDRAANVVRIDEAYTLLAPFASDGGGTRRLDLRADVLDEIATSPPTIARDGPLDFAQPGRYTQEVHVRIPSRWQPKFGAESEEIAGKGFDYARSARTDAKEAVLTYRIEVKQRDIAAADVAAHLERLRNVRESLGASLRFGMPAAVDAQARAERLRGLLRDVAKPPGDKP